MNLDWTFIGVYKRIADHIVIYLISFVLIGIATWAISQNNKKEDRIFTALPPVTINLSKPQNVEFGKIEADQNYNAAISLVNDTSQTLVINNIFFSCGCGKVDFKSPAEVMPGSAVEANLAFSTDNSYGDYIRSIRFTESQGVDLTPKHIKYFVERPS